MQTIVPNASKIHVLIIEDDTQARELLVYFLRILGIEMISEARDGEEGLGVLDGADVPVDIVLCDWNMPRMNGLTLLQMIRRQFNHVPFLMVSGRQDFESVVRAREAGVDAYLHKPVSPVQLGVKLQAALEARIRT